MARLITAVCILLVACAAARNVKHVITNADHPGRVSSEYLITVRQDEQVIKQLEEIGNGFMIKKRHNFGKLSVLVVHSDEEAAVASLNSVPGVLSVEADVREYVLACTNQDLTGIAGLWNLKRTNVRENGGPEKYTYKEGDGSGTTGYVLDTGIFLGHYDFGGRASHGYTVPPYDESEGDEDLNGHGTHCAGTAMGVTYGAAKFANAIAVKVVSRYGMGTISECIDGLEWTFNDFKTKDEASGGQYKAVVSMSLGYSSNSAMDSVIQELSDIGLLTIAAAGNSGASACYFSPSGAAASVSVAASDQFDRLASFTSHGVCVDIIAPGVDILSAGHRDEYDTDTKNGTSMACPLVAGVVLRYLSQVEGRPSPEAIRAWLEQTSTKDAIDLLGHNDTPNNFLYAPCEL